MGKAQEIKAHLYDLSNAFKRTVTWQELKELQAIEATGHKLAEDYCNGVIESEAYDTEMIRIENQLFKYKNSDVEIELNGDPRGHFLKINDDWLRKNAPDFGHRDWGGYGIIAPSELE